MLFPSAMPHVVTNGCGMSFTTPATIKYKTPQAPHAPIVGMFKRRQHTCTHNHPHMDTHTHACTSGACHRRHKRVRVCTVCGRRASHGGASLAQGPSPPGQPTRRCCGAAQSLFVPLQWCSSSERVWFALCTSAAALPQRAGVICSLYLCSSAQVLSTFFTQLSLLVGAPALEAVPTITAAVAAVAVHGSKWSTGCAAVTRCTRGRGLGSQGNRCRTGCVAVTRCTRGRGLGPQGNRGRTGCVAVTRCTGGKGSGLTRQQGQIRMCGPRQRIPQSFPAGGRVQARGVQPQPGLRFWLQARAAPL